MQTLSPQFGMGAGLRCLAIGICLVGGVFGLVPVGQANGSDSSLSGLPIGTSAGALFSSSLLITDPLLQDEETDETAADLDTPVDEGSAADTTEASTEADGEETDGEDEAAAAPAIDNDNLAFAIDNLMLFICAVLVLFMQAGFGMLEAGLNSAKNTVNILCKNLMDLSVGVLLYFLVGYGIMYPGESWILVLGGKELFGFAQVGIPAMGEDITGHALHPQVDFLFQAAFAATAATIVSGAVAGRMKFVGYLIFSAIITGLIYPISGGWKWGGGFLADMGYYDFAGSVVVHAVGGFAGLAGAMILGPRIGRFRNGKSSPIPGHNLTFAALGVFILWIGWYGFNPGSQLIFSDAANAGTVMTIATNTTLSAAMGSFIAMIFAWIVFGKPDLTMGLNGALAGLVGITANCDAVTNLEALGIGLVSGVLVVGGIIALDKLKIDDPVGAFPVHGLCGIWGGIATGIFGLDVITTYDGYENCTLLVQVIGSVIIPAWSFATMLVVFLVLKAIGLLRVSEAHEQAGLDVSEHGMQAYPGSVASDH